MRVDPSQWLILGGVQKLMQSVSVVVCMCFAQQQYLTEKNMWLRLLISQQTEAEYKLKEIKYAFDTYFSDIPSPSWSHLLPSPNTVTTFNQWIMNSKPS